MSNKVLDLLKNIKAQFNAPVVAAPVAAPVTASTATDYILQDGSTISITQAGATPAVGDAVLINGVPATEGILTLQDGTTIAVDATGTITQYTPIIAAAAAPTLEARVADIEAAVNLLKAAPTGAPITTALAADDVQAAIAKFATGSVDEKVANLEIISKALMQNVFGWQIDESRRAADAAAAIDVYKTSILGIETKMAEQAGKIARYEQILPQMFSLVEEMAQAPAADPATLSGQKKEQFDRKEKAVDRYSKVMNQIKAKTAVTA